MQGIKNSRSQGSITSFPYWEWWTVSIGFRPAADWPLNDNWKCNSISAAPALLNMSVLISHRAIGWWPSKANVPIKCSSRWRQCYMQSIHWYRDQRENEHINNFITIVRNGLRSCSDASRCHRVLFFSPYQKAAEIYVASRTKRHRSDSL